MGCCPMELGQVGISAGLFGNCIEEATQPFAEVLAMISRRAAYKKESGW
jgi:hypothetical protein